MTARLEAAAPANEIYIGDVTYRLVRDAVEAENVEPLTLKGISQRVLAYRIISAHGLYGNERRIDTVVVGRDAELSTLLSARAAVIATRRAHLVTVIGDPGVGKSRLVREMIVGAAGIDPDDTPESPTASCSGALAMPMLQTVSRRRRGSPSRAGI